MNSTGCLRGRTLSQRHFSFIILLALALQIPALGVTAGAATSAPGEQGSGVDRRSVVPAAARQGKSVRSTSTLTIMEYYEKASPVNAPALPDGLRVSRRASSGARGKAPPMISSQCLHFAPGEFSRLLLRSPHARRLRELFVEHGVDADKMMNLLLAHGAATRDIASIFDEGYMILFDEEDSAAYIFPIGRNMGEKIFNLTR